jgi:hypothetical protein
MTETASSSEFAQFMTEEQDPAVVERVYNRMKTLLTQGEVMRYIAVQKALTFDPTPEIVVLTNRRFLHYRPKMMGGGDFTDYIWRDIRDVQLSEGSFRSTMVFSAVNGETIRIENLPKDQARRLYAIGQEMEEHVREELRAREMEEKRAAAGGIVLQGAAPVASGPPAADDPMQVLGKLKQLLDGGLISPEEYEAKKREVLSRL